MASSYKSEGIFTSKTLSDKSTLGFYAEEIIAANLRRCETPLRADESRLQSPSLLNFLS